MPHAEQSIGKSAVVLTPYQEICEFPDNSYKAMIIFRVMLTKRLKFHIFLALPIVIEVRYVLCTVCTGHAENYDICLFIKQNILGIVHKNTGILQDNSSFTITPEMCMKSNVVMCFFLYIFRCAMYSLLYKDASLLHYLVSPVHFTYCCRIALYLTSKW